VTGEENIEGGILLLFQRNPRNVSTKKTGCPFSIYGSLNKDSGKWTYVIRNTVHNHDIVGLSSHAVHRRPTAEQLSEVKLLSNAGIKPKRIAAVLRQKDPDTAITVKSISNAKYSIKQEHQNGRTSLQTLLDDLQASSWQFSYALDEHDRIIRLFMIHPESLKLARIYNNVVLGDCTYKTNQFRLKLLNVVGITSLFTTFYVCFCFLLTETYEDYSWFLERFKAIYVDIDSPKVFSTDRDLAFMNALRDKLPGAYNPICQWHVNKNVLKSCKKLFSTSEGFDVFIQDWKSWLYSMSAEEADENWEYLKLTYGEKSKAFLYVETTWFPHKENLLKYCLDRHFHLESGISSRVEGAHSCMKSYLGNSVGDLLVVKESIDLAILNQLAELKLEISAQQVRVPLRMNQDFFRSVARKVSTYALNIMINNYTKARAALANTENCLARCFGRTKNVMGLPCAHDIKKMIEEDRALQLTDVHTHWHLNKHEVVEFVSPPLFAHIRNPPIVVGRGRSAGVENKRGSNDVKRDLVGFEIALSRLEGRKCGRCGKRGTGHNTRTCDVDLEVQ